MAAAANTKTEGIGKHKENGMIYDITLNFTITQDTIQVIHITSTGITLQKNVKELLETFLEGKTINELKKITDKEMQNKTKTEEHLAATINQALQTAIRNHEQKEKGDPFQEAYESLENYNKGYQQPKHQDYGDCSCHSK